MSDDRWLPTFRRRRERSEPAAGRFTALPAAEFVHDGGFCFTAKLRALPRGDSEADPYGSTLRLLQDGVPQGPSHVAHKAIREVGRGRYSHWHDTLYFSAGDNSDPRTNGRAYDVYLDEVPQGAAVSRAIEALRRLGADYTAEEAYAAVEASLKALDAGAVLADPHKLFWRDAGFIADYARVAGPDRRAMERKYTVYQLVKSLGWVPGDLAECGSRNGETAYFMALAGREIGRERSLHIFDSFEGLSAPGEFDGAFWHAGALAAPETKLAANLAGFDGVRAYKGWIPERFAEVADRRFCFVHVDVDLYEPTRDSVAFFYPRLEPGGILLCDDYGSTLCPGARKALDEF